MSLSDRRAWGSRLSNPCQYQGAYTIFDDENGANPQPAEGLVEHMAFFFGLCDYPTNLFCDSTDDLKTWECWTPGSPDERELMATCTRIEPEPAEAIVTCGIGHGGDTVDGFETAKYVAECLGRINCDWES